MKHIAIDLTPILPGGDNGGAKIMTINLIKQIATLAPYHHFYLLANNINYNEIKPLQSTNIDIINIDLYKSFHFNVIIKLLSAFINFLCPQSLKKHLIMALHKANNSISFKKICKKISSVDLLFSPFTAPFFHALKVPNISVIYDLQYHYYPFFFSFNDYNQRKKTFKDACKRSSKLIAISNFVKKTIMENSKFPPEHIHTIHIKLSKRLPILDLTEINEILISLNLTKNHFLLYPANFWAHKNHKMLFTAFNMYRHQYPNSTLKLVCTGTHEEGKKSLLEAIKHMNLSSWIILPGYLSDKNFSALMENSLAIIYPSLYEGFGMPILEAMHAGKPVLCSNVASLPEVAGDAALLFDPRKPDEMANAIHRIESEPDLVQALIKKGQQHAAHFGTEDEMARAYLTLFDEVLA